MLKRKEFAKINKDSEKRIVKTKSRKSMSLCFSGKEMRKMAIQAREKLILALDIDTQEEVEELVEKLADFVVIGRPILNSADPVRTAKQILEEIED